jgi:hypothetical protein
MKKYILERFYYFSVMKHLFRKKYFLEVYMPIAIAGAPFIMMLGGLFGLNLSLGICFCLGLLASITGRIIYLTTGKASQS